MASEAAGIRCRTCTEIRPVNDFYEAATECTGCKKDRSRRNRLVVSQKIALADRVLDLLEDLASRGWRPELCIHANSKQPSEALERQPRASIDSVGSPS